uniref:Ras-associating and dilute domain-containing protein-like n=1 Tax=Petromyzon marinus TaxID=7757 RepID=A0AAJ7U913_PETMA|nr:ras-associating and dilute domain-containing protein-like [Petromyzon marinus]
MVSAAMASPAQLRILADSAVDASSTSSSFTHSTPNLKSGSCETLSVHSTTSGAGGVTLRQPAKNRARNRYSKRFSQVFGRGGAGAGAGGQATPPPPPRGSIAADVGGRHAEDPTELSTQVTAPGVLKIFGGEISAGANYKSVLATPASSAQELVKEALERYGLERSLAGDYVLCEAVGRTTAGADGGGGGGDGAAATGEASTGAPGGEPWSAECLRAIADYEKPLLLQALWKPREGYSRRLELRPRAKVEESAGERDTLTAGINAQARRLQMSRSRVSTVMSASPQLGPPAVPNGGYAEWIASASDLRRTVSDMHIPQRTLCGGGGGGDGGGDGGSPAPPAARAAPTSRPCRALAPIEGDYDLCTGPALPLRGRPLGDDPGRYAAVRPPADTPYLLLLQGCDGAQDLRVYLLDGARHSIGRGAASDRPQDSGDDRPDILLWAPDILPRHCRISRSDPQPQSPAAAAPAAPATEAAGARPPPRRRRAPLVLRPFRGAAVTRNGVRLERPAELRRGDVVALGERYLFLFEDPAEPGHLPSAGKLSSPGGACKLCGASARGGGGGGGGRPAARVHSDANSELRSAMSLEYDPALEDVLLDEIVGLVSPGSDGYQLTPAYLFCLCVQHSAFNFRPADFRRLLLKVANLLQTIAWEKTKELAEKQPEQRERSGGDAGGGGDGDAGGGGDGDAGAGDAELVRELRPIAFWMSNAVELLHFLRQRVPELARDADDANGHDSQDPSLSAALSASEEATSVMEEVVMYTFQQTVYYITKALYAALPGLLDSNPFACGHDAATAVDGHLRLSAGVRRVVAIYTATRELLAACAVHADVAAQLFSYLFFFSNASLFNTLMERGCGGGFYHWSRGVQLRANLDLLLEWLQEQGLGELATQYFHKLSSTADLLATPKLNLLQASWRSLRSDFPALNTAQLHHLLREYQLGAGKSHPATWQPDPDDSQSALRTDVLESFENHPPLVLPSTGFRVDPEGPAPSLDFAHNLRQLRQMLRKLSGLGEGAVAPAASVAEPGTADGEEGRGVAASAGEAENHGEEERARSRTAEQLSAPPQDRGASTGCENGHALGSGGGGGGRGGVEGNPGREGSPTKTGGAAATTTTQDAVHRRSSATSRVKTEVLNLEIGQRRRSMTGPTTAAKAGSNAELGQRRSSASSRVRSEVLGVELGLKERGGGSEGAVVGEGPDAEAGPRRSSASRVKTDVLNVELGSNSRSLSAARKGSGGEVGQARSSTVGTHGGDVLSLRQAELTQRLQHLEIQSMMRKEAPSAPPVPKSLPLDPSCLMTPPNTPLGNPKPPGHDPAAAHRVALASYSTTEGEYETVELPMTAATTAATAAAAAATAAAALAARGRELTPLALILPGGSVDRAQRPTGELSERESWVSGASLRRRFAPAALRSGGASLRRRFAPMAVLRFGGASLQQRFAPAVLRSNGASFQRRFAPMALRSNSASLRRRFAPVALRSSGASLRRRFAPMALRFGGASLQQRFAPTVLRSNGASLQRRFAPTALRSRGASLRRRFAPMALRSSGASLQRRFAPTALRSNGASLQRRFAPVLLRSGGGGRSSTLQKPPTRPGNSSSSNSNSAPCCENLAGPPPPARRFFFPASARELSGGAGGGGGADLAPPSRRGSRGAPSVPRVDSRRRLPGGGCDGAKGTEVTTASPAVRSHDEEEEEGDDEVFVVELSKGQKGLGMGLIDGMYTRLRVPGIYIKTLVPDTPAARCRRLSAGDRILAVNGTTLAGVDYQSAMDMIRSSGDGVRLLIAKVEKKQKQSTRL